MRGRWRELAVFPCKILLIAPWVMPMARARDDWSSPAAFMASAKRFAVIVTGREVRPSSNPSGLDFGIDQV